jgi:hypothetical protein
LENKGAEQSKHAKYSTHTTYQPFSTHIFLSPFLSPLLKSEGIKATFLPLIAGFILPAGSPCFFLFLFLFRVM